MFVVYSIQNDASPGLNATEWSKASQWPPTARQVLSVLAPRCGGSIDAADDAASEEDLARSFGLRVKAADPQFGYVWRDVGNMDAPLSFWPMDQRVFIVARIVRLKGPGVAFSGERRPQYARRIGLPSVPRPAAAAKPATARPPHRSKSSAPAAASSMKASEPLPHRANSAPVVNESVEEVQERARLKTEERLRQEALDQERRVREMREAESARVSSADARDQAFRELRPLLDGWAGPDGNRKPIRALLCNLTTVLWEGTKWTPVNILVKPSEVRLAYRKAMLIVHPDKVSGDAPPAQAVRAKYIFEALNTAFEKFEQSEL